MEKYYEIDEAVLMNSIHDITEVELKELISDEDDAEITFDEVEDTEE